MQPGWVADSVGAPGSAEGVLLAVGQIEEAILVDVVLVDSGELVVGLEQLLAIDEQEEALGVVEVKLLTDDALELVDGELLRDQEPNKMRQKSLISRNYRVLTLNLTPLTS